MGKVTAEVSFSQDSESSASFLALWVHVAMGISMTFSAQLGPTLKIISGNTPLYLATGPTFINLIQPIFNLLIWISFIQKPKMVKSATLLVLGGCILDQAAAAVLGHYHMHVERAACNQDNLYRYFIDTRYTQQASDFCSGLSPSTVTITTPLATA